MNFVTAAKLTGVTLINSYYLQLVYSDSLQIIIRGTGLKVTTRM